MELRQLRYFVAVAETLNFTQAAKRLYITQGTLSQQLKQLEFELGSDLFVRSSHFVALTEAGEELLPMAMKIIEASELCRTKMKDLKKGVCGELRIGVSNSLRRIVGIVARRFMNEYPAVTLQICCGTPLKLHQMLRKQELDLIVTFRQQEPDADLFTTTLFTTQLSAVMSPEHYLAGRKSLSFSDLERFKLIIPGHGLQARQLFEEFFGVDMGGLKQCASINDVDIILELVRGSNRVALLSSVDARDRKDVVAIPMTVGNGEIPSGREMICCAQRLVNGYDKRSTAAFLELLCEQADIERICFES